MTSIQMPQLGETIVEGTILKWLKQEGEHIDVDEPLFELSTDKVDTEVPSPVSGTVTKILVAEGTTVAVGTALAEVDSGTGRYGDGAPPGRRRRRTIPPRRRRLPGADVVGAAAPGSASAAAPPAAAPSPPVEMAPAASALPGQGASVADPFAARAEVGRGASAGSVAGIGDRDRRSDHQEGRDGRRCRGRHDGAGRPLLLPLRLRWRVRLRCRSPHPRWLRAAAKRSSR